MVEPTTKEILWSLAGASIAYMYQIYVSKAGGSPVERGEQINLEEGETKEISASGKCGISVL